VELFLQFIVYSLIVLGFAFSTWLSILNYRNRNAAIPNEVEDIYDQEKYSKWLEYTMENFRYSRIVSSISVVVFILFLAFGVFGIITDFAKNLFPDDTRLQVLVFMGVYYLYSYIVGIFTSYYRTFKIEEKFGFNKTTTKTFVFDKIKSLLLTIILGGSLIYGITVLAEVTGDAFFIYAWISIMVIFLVINMIYTSVIVPLFNKLTPLEDGELKEAIHDFAKSVGYEVSKISVMDASRRSSKLNAFFSGFGKFKKIVLYDTLVEKMTTEEIVAVLAHEIGHNKHKHIVYNLFQTAFILFIYIGVFGFILRNPLFVESFGLDFPNFGFALIIFSVLIEPLSIVIGLITSGLSRKHEYQADHFAATKYQKEPMISALKVLSRENFSNLTPHPLYVKLTYSHPPTVDRIRAIGQI
jgi:STE24 endopeptidase